MMRRWPRAVWPRSWIGPTLALMAKAKRSRGRGGDEAVDVVGHGKVRSMDDTVELRQAVATDAAAIRELTRAAYAKWVPLIGREPKPMTANYEERPRQAPLRSCCTSTARWPP